MSLTLFEPRFHPLQQKGQPVRGSDFKAYLEEQGLLDRVLTLDDEIVREWRLNPESYPSEFRAQKILLITSLHPDNRTPAAVASLEWLGMQLIVDAVWLGHMLEPNRPVLIRHEGSLAA